MHIRKKYYPCYNNSERQFILKYLASSKLIRAVKKYERNFWLSIGKRIALHVGFRYCSVVSCHSLPINWGKEEIISSLKREYQNEVTQVNYLFSKDIPTKEHPQLKEESQKKLKEKYKYLLDLIEEIKSIDI